jgi:hypothetical protein
MATLQNSTFLDYVSWHLYPDLNGSVTAAYGSTSSIAGTNASFNVALVLPRNGDIDPTSLLDSNWATRQTTLAGLNAQGTLWQTYGANQQQFDGTIAQLQADGIPILGLGGDGYVTSAASRTIWVHLDYNNFGALLGQYPQLATGGPSGDFYYWNGSLTLPSSITVAGLAFDYGFAPAIQAQSSNAYAAPHGAQSIGNTATSPSSLYPQQVAALYDFPLNGNAGVTGTLALIEPGIGSTLAPGTTATFGALLGAYLAQAGVTGSPNLYTVANGGQTYNPNPNGPDGERSLDIGVTAAVNPWATYGIYAGSGSAEGAHANVFTAYHSAIWDFANNPSVMSSSFFEFKFAAPNSPFLAAQQGLFEDAALRNISLFVAGGDGGSGAMFADGLDNIQYANSSPYVVQVGGTSLTLAQSASSDSTMGVLLSQVQAQNPATIWQLMQSGLKTMPLALAPNDPLLESVWNAYSIHNGTFTGQGLNADSSGAGGVDTRLDIPPYQSDYGLTPTNNDPTGGTGRGSPDVTALAGGDTYYIAPIATMEGTSSFWHGTSAAAPLWASLALQVDAIFHDQGLPSLGYAIDLLYIASVIAPGSFNDINQGNNISSYISGGPYLSDGSPVTLTGFGYTALSGYDLASGLGSPNGMLLARTLTSIAHEQMSFGSSPPLLDHAGDGWTSATDQSLLFQTSSAGNVTVGIGVDTHFAGFTSAAGSLYAWTSQLAQQVLQPDFDPNLVTLFDKQGQGSVLQMHAADGSGIAVAVDQQLGNPLQVNLSDPFGFSDFFTQDGTVRVARAVSVAETVDGQNDQTAIVRIRQDGTDHLAVTFYKVDDFSGRIDSLSPGDPGYAQSAMARAYQIGSGGISMGGPGYGNFEQGTLLHVNAGDKVAMFLTDNSTGVTYWAFAQANETFAGQKVAHLWNYGLNTWGWEDGYNGGDHDFNDLVVGIDFTSAYGHGWLS